MRDINRRTLLKSAAALAAGATTPWASSARASEFELGSAKILTLSDGQMSLPFDRVIAGDLKPEVKAFLMENEISLEGRTSDLNLTLLRDGDRTVLFDIGSGSNFLDGTGTLLDSMDELGVDPEEVTHVVFTHAHPDHLWGVLDDMDDPTLPNAQYMISDVEWDYWTGDKATKELPEELLSFAAGAKRYLSAIENNITQFKAGEEILPGIQAVASHGHSPGHTSFEVRNGSESVMVVGDAIAHELISFAKPDWYAGSDQNKAEGAATRVKLLDRLTADKTRMIGYHLPDGGFGHVEKVGNKGYRFVNEG